jgi:hypothetical protein
MGRYHWRAAAGSTSFLTILSAWSRQTGRKKCRAKTRRSGMPRPLKLTFPTKTPQVPYFLPLC